MTRLTCIVLLFLAAGSRADGEVTYLANAGLMIAEGDTKVLFDPLFRNGFGQYRLQNIAFRVTINSQITVLHLGDADARDDHFARDGDQWASRGIDAVFPPYWYFSSGKGRHVLTTRLKPRHSVGVHVPLDMPDNPSDRPAEYRGYDLFTEPGQSRRIEITQ